MIGFRCMLWLKEHILHLKLAAVDPNCLGMGEEHVVGNNVRQTLRVATYAWRGTASNIWIHKCSMMNLIEGPPVLHTIPKCCKTYFRECTKEWPAETLEKWIQKYFLVFISPCGSLKFYSKLTLFLCRMHDESIRELTQFQGTSSHQKSLVMLEAGRNGTTPPRVVFLCTSSKGLPLSTKCFTIIRSRDIPQFLEDYTSVRAPILRNIFNLGNGDEMAGEILQST